MQFNYHRNMHAVELKFQASAPGNADEVHNAITTFTAALVRNDNLVQNSLISDQSLTWTVHGIAPGPDALKESYWNKYIHDASAGLSAVSVNGPDVRYLGVIPETGSVLRVRENGSTTPLHHIHATGAPVAVHGMQWDISDLLPSALGFRRTDGLALMGKQLSSL